MAHIRINNKNERFGSAVSIADLAQYAEIFKKDSDDLHIYEIEEYMSKEYKHELEHFEYEFGSHYHCRFKDGSEMSVGAYFEGVEHQ